MKNPFNQTTHPNCYDGHNYALDVIEGRIVACIYVIGACRRYLDDLEKSYDDFEYPYYFDTEKAEKYLRRVQMFWHVEGHWKTREIIYEAWQKFIFMNIEGFHIRETKTRKYRTAHIEVARGQGKSTAASQSGLYHMRLEENPNGNHVYCVATKKEQARIVLDSARAMALANKDFLKKTGVEVFAHHLAHEESNSFMKALSSQKDSLDGLKGKLIITDELHAMKRETFETLDSGQSKRRDSLLLSITTAGYDTGGVGASQSAYAKKVSMGEVKDETFFALVYTIDEGDDPFDPSIWIKANPGFGTIVDPVNFEAKANKAKENPADLNGFMIKHLNVWTSSSSPFFNLNKWDECTDISLNLKNFLGKKCFVGLDLASKIDLCTYVMLFKDEDGIYYLFDRSYLPESTVEESRNDNYRLWVNEGHIIKTPGSAINYMKLQEDFKQSSFDHRFAAVNYDPWNAVEFATRMTQERIEMVEFSMNVSNMSEPMKMFDAHIREKKICHNGSPLLRWCLGNVVAKRDHNDNVFPRKEHENNKIDPIIAGIMALAGWINEEEKSSVYESRGIRFL